MPSDDTRVVAFCGTRGLPANYGGFETAVDEISRRFVASGWTCDVFCRRSSGPGRAELPDEHEHRRLVYVDGSRRSTLDTVVSSIQTGLRLFRQRHRYAHVFWFNNANLPGILLTRIAGIPMTVNTDGLEWRRAKWRAPFKLYYVASSLLISGVCKTLVSDSVAIQTFYRERFFKRTTFVPYGGPSPVAVTEARELEILRELGLEPGRYLLQITRVEPDNLPVPIARAFQDSGLHEQGFAMVSIGLRDKTPYAASLIALDGERGVRVRPAIYDPVVLQVLRKHCRCYLHGNSVGGTNPALLEAMTVCPRVAAIDCEFSREVLGETGWFFTLANAAEVIRGVAVAPDRSAEMQARIAQHYQWSAVSACYLDLASGAPADYRAKLAALR